MSKRVLLAGLFHETHTFLEGVTAPADWEIRRGEELLQTAGDGSPLGGVVDVARDRGWELIPTIDYRATPSATVADEVVEQFWKEFQSRAEKPLAEGIDGVYLVLHGAMASESLPDVEGDLLQRLGGLLEAKGADRAAVCGVLDLHCNYTAAMAAGADALIAYRENPHIDAEESARRAAVLLDELMASGRRPKTVWNRPPLVWPPTGVGTGDDPMRTLERMAREIETAHEHILAVNVFAGFAFADTPDTGVSFSAVTLGDVAVAEKALAELGRWAMEHREAGNMTDPPIESVMTEALAHAKGPVLLVEPADNIGGGAPGDGTGVLRALLKHEAQNAAVVINDPESAAACHRSRPGERLKLSIGGRSPMSGGPVELQVELLSTSDGRFDLEDRNSHLASMRGIHIDMGPSAVVRHSGIRILLTTRKTPPFDLGQLRSQGIVPEELSLIGVKAAVAHRRAYDPIAAASYTVDTPGPCTSNLNNFPYRRLRRPVYPLDDV